MNVSEEIRRLSEDKITRFDSLNKVTEDALSFLFKACPDNTDPAQVLLKVAAINSLYSTQVYAVREISDHIVRCEVDDDLKAGKVDVVDKIAKITIKGKERRNYSFATKYCSWHNPDCYPIYDARAEKCLRIYQKINPFTEEKLTQDNLCNYEFFRNAVDAFRNKYLPGMSFKQVDKFLFQLDEDNSQTTSPIT